MKKQWVIKSKTDDYLAIGDCEPVAWVRAIDRMSIIQRKTVDIDQLRAMGYSPLPILCTPLEEVEPL